MKEKVALIFLISIVILPIYGGSSNIQEHLETLKMVFYFTLQVEVVSLDVGVDVPSVAKHVAM